MERNCSCDEADKIGGVAYFCVFFCVIGEIAPCRINHYFLYSFLQFAKYPLGGKPEWFVV
jgi:hypothetical protein